MVSSNSTYHRRAGTPGCFPCSTNTGRHTHKRSLISLFLRNPTDAREASQPVRQLAGPTIQPTDRPTHLLFPFLPPGDATDQKRVRPLERQLDGARAVRPSALSSRSRNGRTDADATGPRCQHCSRYKVVCCCCHRLLFLTTFFVVFWTHSASNLCVKAS